MDVRVLSATHQNLEASIAADQFREDLYYRLNVVELILPALRERREDIPLLAKHFLTRLGKKYGKHLNGFSSEALTALSAAPWPGNIRQLHNVIEQVCALSTTPIIPLSLVH
ncbi:sigma-54 dependent transcriptional regulator/response regulator, partial [mine drainage metagenome]